MLTCQAFLAAFWAGSIGDTARGTCVDGSLLSDDAFFICALKDESIAVSMKTPIKKQFPHKRAFLT